MLEVAVEEMARHQLPFAAGVLGRGFRDNPNTVSCLGDDPVRRMRGAERVLGTSLSMMQHPPLVACRGDWIVGVCATTPPGTCQPSPLGRLRLMAAALRSGPVPSLRMLRWQSVWAEQDPDERHWHVALVAVEPALQGMGIGSQMLARLCGRMDREQQVAYLETDKPENVRFYRKVGFETIAEAEVLGRPNWFMRREPVRP